jgi:hypothetical protein
MEFITNNIVTGTDYHGEKGWYPEPFRKDLAQDLKRE